MYVYIYIYYINVLYYCISAYILYDPLWSFMILYVLYAYITIITLISYLINYITYLYTNPSMNPSALDPRGWAKGMPPVESALQTGLSLAAFKKAAAMKSAELLRLKHQKNFQSSWSTKISSDPFFVFGVFWALFGKGRDPPFWIHVQLTTIPGNQPMLKRVQKGRLPGTGCMMVATLPFQIGALFKWIRTFCR